MTTFAENLEKIRKDIIGLPVNLPWKGYGSTIFLELGKLAPLKGRENHSRGEACISISWDWRVERGHEILFGSSNRGTKIEQGIQLFKNQIIEEVDITGTVLELEVKLSRGFFLRSMCMCKGETEWSIRLLNGQYAKSEKGMLIIDQGLGGKVSEEENRVFDLAKKTAQRWAVPAIEPKKGKCWDCQYYIRLDGNGHMLDYGVCVSKDSALDGRVVHINSGCPVYASKESN
jgi:hypothetical protein